MPFDRSRKSIMNDSVYVVSDYRGEGEYRVYARATVVRDGLNLNSVQIMEEPTSAGGDTLVVFWVEKRVWKFRHYLFRYNRRKFAKFGCF